jgi:hypothetical protein
MARMVTGIAELPQKKIGDGRAARLLLFPTAARILA